MIPLVLLLLLGTTSALEVGPLRLPDNRAFISFGLGSAEDNSRIICNYILDEGEEVSTVLWQILKDGEPAGSYEWNTNTPATGLLEDKVNLQREDSDLELTELSYDLSAFYKCTVTTTDGTAQSFTDEVLVIDTTTNHIYVHRIIDEYDCKVGLGIRFFPVFPEPTVRAGVYDYAVGDYYQEVDTWEALMYPNGTVELSFEDYYFDVTENSPDDPALKHEISITKSDGTEILLNFGVLFFSFRRSCEDVDINASQKLSYDSDLRTCYGEPLASVGTIECAEGYHSVLNVTSVSQYCEHTDGSYVWVSMSEGLMAEDLVCEPDSGVSSHNSAK